VSDLVTWLRAQIDEDERVAQAAIRQYERAVAEFKAGRPPDVEELPGETAADWSGGSDEDDRGYFRRAVWAGDGMIGIAEMYDEQDEASPAHMARWDPARVLTEVEAKREILDRYERVDAEVPETWSRLGTGPDDEAAERIALEWVVKQMTLPYRDRPGYEPVWAPE
jgi:Family of unknown function (DUF6221)